jgi:hypothetical protein
MRNVIKEGDAPGAVPGASTAQNRENHTVLPGDTCASAVKSATEVPAGSVGGAEPAQCAAVKAGFRCDLEVGHGGCHLHDGGDALGIADWDEDGVSMGVGWERNPTARLAARTGIPVAEVARGVLPVVGSEVEIESGLVGPAERRRKGLPSSGWLRGEVIGLHRDGRGFDLRCGDAIVMSVPLLLADGRAAWRVAGTAEHVPGSEDPAAFDDPEAAARSLAIFVPQEGDDVRVQVGAFRRPIRRALANSLRALFAGFECEWSRLEKRAHQFGTQEALLAEVKGLADAQLVKVVETIGETL